MPNGQVYKNRQIIPDYTLDTYNGRLSDLKNRAYRDMFSKILVAMEASGDNPTDYLLRLSESRQPEQGQFHGAYDTHLELHAVPLTEARSILGGR
jgi:hypothetical protein